MRRNILYLILFFIILTCVPTVSAQDDLLAVAKDMAAAALIDRFDEGNGVIYVYRDFSFSLNHFTQKRKCSGESKTRSMIWMKTGKTMFVPVKTPFAAKSMFHPATGAAGFF